MRAVSIRTVFILLDTLRDEFREAVSSYERSAESCAVCTTPGACCLDAHFVNVRISPLEGEAIRNALNDLPPDKRARVFARIDDAIDTYKLDEMLDTSAATYACPLFEKGIGCLVHSTAKPLPCIAHACYENESDLPPDDLLDEAELQVDRLNRRIFGRARPQQPIPLAVRRGDRT